MKSIIVLLIALQTTLTFGQSQHIRSQCENYYYATGNVKLYQYSFVIDWSKISDSALTQLEDVIYGDHFDVTVERELSAGKTLYNIKEVSGFGANAYMYRLNQLNELTSVGCLYDL